VFIAVFSLFVLAMVVLIGFIIRWAIQRDRAARRSPTKKD
jgi:cell division protein FtsX